MKKYILLLAFLFVANLVSADDTPGNFFERDYAKKSQFENDPEAISGGKKKSPLFRRKDSADNWLRSEDPASDENEKTIRDSLKTIEDGLKKKALESTQPEGFSNQSLSDEKPAEASALPAAISLDTPPDGDGLPVSKISLYVNSMDRKHFSKSLQELYNLHDTRTLKLGTVMAVGNLDSVIPKEISMEGIHTAEAEVPITGVYERGGLLRVISKTPDRYPVKLSPTWIVELKKGEVILEAVPGVQRFFNKKGELLVRSEDLTFSK